MDPTSELSVLESPQQQHGRPPKKKPRRSELIPNIIEGTPVKEDDTPPSPTEVAAEGRRARQAASAREEERFSRVFETIEAAGFPTLYDFLEKAFETKNQQVSARIGRLVSGHGSDLLGLIAARSLCEVGRGWRDKKQAFCRHRLGCLGCSLCLSEEPRSQGFGMIELQLLVALCKVWRSPRGRLFWHKRMAVVERGVRRVWRVFSRLSGPRLLTGGRAGLRYTVVISLSKVAVVTNATRGRRGPKKWKW